MSKMSADEEEAVQAELQALQKEAMVRVIIAEPCSFQPSVPVVPDPVALPSVPAEEPTHTVGEGEQTDLRHEGRADSQTQSLRLRFAMPCQETRLPWRREDGLCWAYHVVVWCIIS